jgi:hypothetical protein
VIYCPSGNNETSNHEKIKAKLEDKQYSVCAVIQGIRYSYIVLRTSQQSSFKIPKRG